MVSSNSRHKTDTHTCDKEPPLFLLMTNFMATITSSFWPKTSKWVFLLLGFLFVCFGFFTRSNSEGTDPEANDGSAFFHSGPSAQPRTLRILPNYFKREGHSLAALITLLPTLLCIYWAACKQKKKSSKWTRGIKSYTAYLKQLYVAWGGREGRESLDKYIDVDKYYHSFFLSAAYVPSYCLICFSLFPCSSLKLSCHHLSRLLLLKAQLPQGPNRNQNSKPCNKPVAAVTKSTIFVTSPPPPLSLPS